MDGIKWWSLSLKKSAQFKPSSRKTHCQCHSKRQFLDFRLKYSVNQARTSYPDHSPLWFSKEIIFSRVEFTLTNHLSVSSYYDFLCGLSYQVPSHPQLLPLKGQIPERFQIMHFQETKNRATWGSMLWAGRSSMLHDTEWTPSKRLYSAGLLCYLPAVVDSRWDRDKVTWAGLRRIPDKPMIYQQ